MHRHERWRMHVRWHVGGSNMHRHVPGGSLQGLTAYRACWGVGKNHGAPACCPTSPVTAGLSGAPFRAMRCVLQKPPMRLFRHCEPHTGSESDARSSTRTHIRHNEAPCLLPEACASALVAGCSFEPPNTPVGQDAADMRADEDLTGADGVTPLDMRLDEDLRPPAEDMPTDAAPPRDMRDASMQPDLEDMRQMAPNMPEMDMGPR